MIEDTKIILGIDPGTNVLGYGNLKIQGKSIELLNMGVITLDKIKDPFEKLQKIFERVQYLIETYGAVEVATEAPFYGKNPQSMLKLGRAQGVAIAAAMTMGVPVYEYAPKKVKVSVTGNGNASKEQVAAMLQNLLKYKASPKYLDATDALSVALCHHFQGDVTTKRTEYKDWSAFVKANPGKSSKGSKKQSD